MRTTFENLKIGSKFKVFENDEYHFTKVDDDHYSLSNRVEEMKAAFVVYPAQLSDLKKPEIPKRQHTDLNIGKLLLIGFIIIWILSALLSSHNSTQPDYLGSAEEKMDKGLPLNSQEQKAVDDAAGVKSDQDQSKDIEKKHGE
jgi:hypothetical protein